jgi:DNA polymerase III subunit delta'
MILGHKKQLQYLREIAKSKRIPHALLFCGQEKLGKKTVALEFLKFFFGQKVFNHPDFIFVEPAENEIQISQIRDLNWKLSLKPFSAPFKAAVIDRAHMMNQEAQNCFLKTLEEPKGDTMIILVSEYPELLLPTIRSRMQKLRFYPILKKEMEDYLRINKVQESEIGMLVDISNGKSGVAIDFLSDPEKLKNFKKNIKDITEVLDSDLAFKFNYAKDLSQREDLKDVLEIWLDYFRNILLSRFNMRKRWTFLKKEYSPEKLKIILKNIQTTIFLTSTTNVNKKLSLELLLTEV